MIDISFSAGATPGSPGESGSGVPFQATHSYPMAPGTIFLEDPISPLGYYQGSPVIYGKVTETQGGVTASAGKTVYEFDAPVIYLRSLSGYYTGMGHDASATSVDWQNGYLKKMTIYSGADVKIKEIENSYTGFTSEVCHGIMILDRVVYQGILNYISHTPGSIEDTGSHASQYFYHYWTNEMTGWLRLSGTTEKEFSSETDNIGTGTNTSYIYGNTDLTGQQKNYLLSRMVIRDLQGGLLEQKDYTYAHKAGSTAVSMYSKNMLNYPYEETVTGRDGIVVFKSRVEYDMATLRAGKIYRSFSSETPLLEFTIVKRDTYGNVIETKDKAGISTVRLWGYKGQYPVAEIINATYQQVLDILGTAIINQILTAAQPTAAQLSSLNALRSNNSLSSALVTTWEFTPLVGVTKITDPSGRVIEYIYNTSNRLSEIKDDRGHLMQSFEYQMAK